LDVHPAPVFSFKDPGIDSKKPIMSIFVAKRGGITALYIPILGTAPIDCSKIPALDASSLITVKELRK
jgi:hypothetical protein